VPDKAIVLTGGRLPSGPDGSQTAVRRPRVEADRCIGCGICENKCPLRGEAAIRVVPAGTGLGAAVVKLG
jgi:Pyruvate/2-oxoacid:ferredoxin oxidoreductase delta subunit